MLLSTASRPAVELAQPTVQCGGECFPRRAEGVQQQFQTDHSPPSSVEVKISGAVYLRSPVHLNGVHSNWLTVVSPP
jgi:hypothetical protein